MKVTIIVPSNRPFKFKRFSDSFHYLGDLRDKITIHVSAQEPWKIDELQEYQHGSIIDSFSFHEKAYPTEMIKWRRAGMEANPNSDYYWFLDDDHQFANSSNSGLFRKTCFEYYKDVFEYLEKNQDVGVLSCRGYFGGYAWGYEIKKNPKNGLIATAHGGLFIKNIGLEKICPLELVNNVGALYESVLGYNTISNGYNFAKRYNSPTKTESVKHIGNDNLTYSKEVISKNNQKYVREKFDDPSWEHSSKKYPKGIEICLKKKFAEEN